MSEEIKKVDETEQQEPKVTELSDKDLDNVAGGAGWDLQKNTKL